MTRHQRISVGASDSELHTSPWAHQQQLNWCSVSKTVGAYDMSCMHMVWASAMAPTRSSSACQRTSVDEVAQPLRVSDGQRIAPVHELRDTTQRLPAGVQQHSARMQERGGSATEKQACRGAAMHDRRDMAVAQLLQTL